MFALVLCAFLGSHFWPLSERGHRVREACGLILGGYSSRHHMLYKFSFLRLLGKTLRISFFFGNVILSH